MNTLLHSVPPILKQVTMEPRLCWRLLNTHGRVWVSFLWGHCSFLLGPGAHKVLFVPSKSLFPQSCVSSGGSIVGLMATSSKRAYATLRSQKWQNDLYSFPRQTIQYHSNPNLCPDQQRWRSQSWRVLWRIIRPSRTNTKKRCPLLYRGLECKSRKSRDTWNNWQIWPGSTKQSRTKANPVSLREHTACSKHPCPTTRVEKTLHVDITRWSILKSDWSYSLQTKLEKLYTVSKNKTWSRLWLRSWLLIAKFRLTLKKLGETTRPLRYDQNQIPYDYTVEVTNIQGIRSDRVPEELWRFETLYRRQWSRPSPRKRNAKR